MRRLLPVLVGAVLVVGGLYGLVTVFSGRDTPGVEADASGPGTLEPDEGARHVDGEAVGTFSSPPPSSGPHAARNATREGTVDDAALLHALELGDVAFVYGTDAPPAGLERLRDDVSGPFDPELAAAGQMVILVRRRGVQGVQGLAWRRRLEVAAPRDERLRAFAEAWLGKGAGNTG